MRKSAFGLLLSIFFVFLFSSLSKNRLQADAADTLWPETIKKSMDYQKKSFPVLLRVTRSYYKKRHLNTRTESYHDTWSLSFQSPRNAKLTSTHGEIDVKIVSKPTRQTQAITVAISRRKLAALMGLPKATLPARVNPSDIKLNFREGSIDLQEFMLFTSEKEVYTVQLESDLL